MNSQPLGFYTDNQLVQDVRRHGIEVRPIDVRFSDWDCTLELYPNNPDKQPAIRLGYRLIKGFQQACADRIFLARQHKAFFDVEDLCMRADLNDAHQTLLADASALKGIVGHRHRARWAIQGVEKQLPLFGDIAVRDAPVSLPMPTLGEDVAADYTSVGLTLGKHPLALLRSQLRAQRCERSRDLLKRNHGSQVRMAGLVTLRQRPETAGGATFVTLEDEDGMVNVVVWQNVGERQRRVLLESQLMVVEGRWESADGVQHLIAGRLRDLSPMLGSITMPSRDFR